MRSAGSVALEACMLAVLRVWLLLLLLLLDNNICLSRNASMLQEEQEHSPHIDPRLRNALLSSKLTKNVRNGSRRPLVR